MLANITDSQNSFIFTATGIARSVSPGQSLRSVAAPFPSATSASTLPAEVITTNLATVIGQTMSILHDISLVQNLDQRLIIEKKLFMCEIAINENSLKE